MTRSKTSFFHERALLLSFVFWGIALAQNDGIMLAGILDMDNFDWAPNIFKVTVDLLNDRNNGFFDEEMKEVGPISYKLVNSKCDEFEALSGYLDVQPFDAIIGARCSSASKQLAWMGAIDDVPQISMSSTSARL